MELDYGLKCNKCLSEYRTPIQDESKFKLYYKTQGPFSLPKSAYGSYSTILTYLFFAANRELRSTSMMSFELTSKIDKQVQEIDLAMFIKESEYRDPIIKLVLVEAK